MDLGEALITVLKAATAVTALTGSGDDARIYWIRRDQGSVLPALVLASVGGAPDDLDLDGGADFQESRVQGSCLAASHAEARALAKAFSDALLDADEVDGFLFWEAEASRPIDRGGETVDGTFVHEIDQDVLLRHSPSA